MAEMREFELIARLRAIHDGALPHDVEVSIGDDAAVLQTSGRLLWTVDAQVDHVHFERAWLSAEDIGFRAHAAATSDVYAMGGTPVASLAGYILGPGDGPLAESLARGARASAAIHGAPTIGGNISRGAELSVTTSVLGACDRPVLRAGANLGDGIYVAGDLGHAALGLWALEHVKTDVALEAFVAAWRRPRLQCQAAQELHAASAAIDVSDGLLRDLQHILEVASLGAELTLTELVDDNLARAARAFGLDGSALALAGGEDYALLATSAHPLPGFRRIGIVVEGGLVVRDASGAALTLPSPGFEHRFTALPSW